jgi:probable F420-dependent oxidoreductase
VARISAQIVQQHGDYAGQRRAWLQAEEYGADAILNWDHFYPLYGDPDGPHFECWSLLAAMAEVTERIEIGALVTCNSYRNPNLLADMARTVDHISGGRLIFGIGAGWFQRDYEEYGYEFGTAPERLRALDANLPVFKARWAKLNPPPTRRIPILIGGGGEKVTLRIVAQHADTWHVFADLEALKHKIEVLRGHCERVGRDFSEIEISCAISRETVDRIDEFAALGASHFTLHATGPDYDLSLLPELCAWRDGLARSA